jgi:hypothetical protein
MSTDTNTDQPTPDDAVALAMAAIEGQAVDTLAADGGEVIAETKAKTYVNEALEAIYAKRSSQVVTPGDESLQAMARASAEGLPDDFTSPTTGQVLPNGEAAAPVVAAASGVPAVATVAAVEPADEIAARAVREQIEAARRKSLNDAATENFRRSEELLAQAQKRSTGTEDPSGETADTTGQEVMDALMTSDPVKLRASLAQIVKEVAPQAGQVQQVAPQPTVPGTRSTESVQLANYVFEHEFKDVLGSDAAFGAAKQAMIERMNDPQYAGVPLDLMARDIGYGMRRQFAADLVQSPASAPVDPVAQQLATRAAAKLRLPRSVTAGAPQIAQPVPAATDGQQSRSTYVQQLRARSGSNTAIRSGEARTATR